MSIKERVEVVARLDVGSLWDSLLGEFLSRWETLSRQGADPATMERELRAHLDGLSESSIEQIARGASGISYNQGREDYLVNSNVEFVVRSEVLDQSTCEVCATLDGQVFEVGSDEFFENEPPSKCLGGGNCRGFYVPLPTR